MNTQSYVNDDYNHEQYDNIYMTYHEKMDMLLKDKRKQDLVNECRDSDHNMTECESMKRMEIVLTVYQSLMEFDALWRIGELLTVKSIYEHQQVTNDFLHLLMQHGNDEILKYIANKIEDLECNGYLGHSHDKMPQTININSMAINNKDVAFQQECYKLHSFVLHILKRLRQIKGFWCDSRPKKNILIEDEKRLCLKNETHQRLLDGTMDRNMTAKYDDLKEETLNNGIASYDWDRTSRKAELFQRSWAAPKFVAETDGRFYDEISNVEVLWKKGDVIDMEEIMALKLYTDYDDIKDKLQKCLRWNENRISTVFHLRYKIMIVIHKFGTNKFGSNKEHDNMQLYHATNCKTLLNHIVNGPVSTTSSYQVAKIIATKKGMVLRVTPKFLNSNDCRAFDVSLVTDYPEEQEWLIGFKHLRILEVKTCPLVKKWKGMDELLKIVSLQNVVDDISRAIDLFKEEILSMSCHLERYLTAFIEYCLYEDDESFWIGDNETKPNEISIWIRNILMNETHHLWKHFNPLWKEFNEFRASREMIKIDTISKGLKPYFISNNSMCFDKIIRIYPNLIELQLINKCQVDEIAFNTVIKQIAVKKMNKLKKLKFLYYDTNDIYKKSLSMLNEYESMESKPKSKNGFEITLCSQNQQRSVMI